MIFQPFIDGVIVPIIFRRDLKDMRVRIEVNNEIVMGFELVKTLGEFKCPFIYSMGSLELQIEWDLENEKVVLMLDGQNYESLPWLDPSFCKYHNNLRLFG